MGTLMCIACDCSLVINWLLVLHIILSNTFTVPLDKAANVSHISMYANSLHFGTYRQTVAV